LSKKDDRQFWMGIYTLATVGINLVVATFIGLGMGWFIDHKLFHERTTPWFTLIFLLLGIVAGFRNIFRMARGKGGSMDEGDDNDE
jgi:ATP synthase protein I